MGSAHRILVAGASGWLGSATLEHARVRCEAVAGISRHGDPKTGAVACDASDSRAVAELCDEFRPTVVINCVRSVEAGGQVTRCLLEESQRLGARLMHVGSAAEYGAAFRQGRPVGERTTPRPLSAYGRGKAAETAMALAALQAGGDIVIGRVFNLIGPGEPEGTVAGDWIKRLQTPSGGVAASVEVIAAVRDFVDIRDAAGALFFLATASQTRGLYNVCSGRGTRIDRLVRMIAHELHVLLRVRSTPARWGAAAGVPAAVGSPRRINRCGWRARIPLQRSVHDLVHGVTVS